jgi:hypothetical protein
MDSAFKLDLKDGTEHALYFDVGAARKFKRTYGESLHGVWSLGSAGLAGLDPDCLCHTISAGLLHEDPDCTPDRVQKMLDRYIAKGYVLEPVIQVTSKAVLRLFKAPDPAETDAGKASPTPSSGSSE